MTYLMSRSNHAPSSPFGLRRSRPRVGWILQRCFQGGDLCRDSRPPKHELGKRGLYTKTTETIY
jgi:hypothetical protein